MKLTDSIFLRIVSVVAFWVIRLRLFAQEDEDDLVSNEGLVSRGRGQYVDWDLQFINVGISDVLIVVLLLVGCYFLGKYWKGLSYLLLCLAALVYYYVRN